MHPPSVLSNLSAALYRIFTSPTLISSNQSSVHYHPSNEPFSLIQIVIGILLQDHLINRLDGWLFNSDHGLTQGLVESFNLLQKNLEDKL
jgi:hypothetical protein